MTNRHIKFGDLYPNEQFVTIKPGLETKVRDTINHNKLDQELNKYKESLSSTCFSEILEDSLNVIEEAEQYVLSS